MRISDWSSDVCSSDLAELEAMAPKLLPYECSVWQVLDEKRKAGERILFEGAQGIMLDVDHGTYPYVTSSNTVAGQAATGAGFGPEIGRASLGKECVRTCRYRWSPYP